MSMKRFFGRPLSGLVLMSVPVLALLALSPWSSASQVSNAELSSLLTAGDAAVADADQRRRDPC